MSQSGSVGTNHFSSAAPSPVPDYTPHERGGGGVTGGDGGPKPHNEGGLTRTSGVGACEYQTSVATTPIVHSHLPVTVSASVRSAQVIDSVHAVHDSAQLGIKPFPISSSGMDQSWVAGSGAID